MAFVNVVY